MSAESHPSALAHHFSDLEQQQEASTLGMWAFLITEIMFFGGLFTGYIVYRSAHPEAFAEGSHHLDLLFGSINTAILIGSSLTMALAVHSAQVDKQKMLIRFLLATMFLGAVFLGIKGYEYHHKFQEHMVPGWDFAYEGPYPQLVQLFISFYFTMTGLHALHMVIGIGILSVLVIQAWRRKFSSIYYTPVELTGLYWHFVDIVWIFLFPLFYLVG